MSASPVGTEDPARLCTAPTSTLAAAIRDGRVTSQALLEAYLERIRTLDPALNAVVATDETGARKRAEAADVASSRGESWGPLHGVPFTIKDSFEVAGLPTTSGAPRLRDHRPRENAVAVQRLVDAGAVLFGKTNVPFLAQDLQSYNTIHGTTNNPWDHSRTPGGSSGGAAAALAAGLTGGELGSDIGGSIRTPAHYTGVYGHKPSYGIVPHQGHIPGPPGTLSEPDLAVVGPLGRSAADLELLLDVIAGPDGLDDRAWSLSLPPDDRSLEEFRVLAWLDDPDGPIDAAVLEPLRTAVGELRECGVRIEEGPPEGVGSGEAYDLYMSMLAAVMGGGLPAKLYRRLRRAATLQRWLRRPVRPARLSGYATGATQSHRDWLRANEARAKLRARWERLFERYDLVLMPVVPVLAIRHLHEGNLFTRSIEVNGGRRPYTDLLRWIAPATLLHLPATVAPVGLSRGMPVGIQIVGPYLHDRRTLRFAGLLAGVRPPPGAPPAEALSPT